MDSKLPKILFEGCLYGRNSIKTSTRSNVLFIRMTDLPESLFANPVWHALQTKHRHFAVSAGDACRYPADVAPFAAVATPSTIALNQLHSLLTPGESVWLIGESYPRVP